MHAYNSYKDSDVKWIGQIPADWAISKIKFQADINKKTLPDNTIADYELQYIDISNVDSNGNINGLQSYLFKDAPSRARRIIKKDDILVSTVRTYLKAITSIEEVENNTICSTGFAVLSPKQSCNADYLSYLIRSEIYIDEIVSRSTGVSYPAINASEIGSLECIMPDKETQKRIGDFLNIKSKEVEEIVKLKQNLIYLLEEKRQSLITEAFIKGVNPNVKMKDSGVEWIGEIPENWIKSKLKYVTNQIIDGTHFTPNYTEEGVPFLRVTDITKSKGNSINMNEVKFISYDEHRELNKRCNPEKGDILVSKNGTIGIPRVVDWDFEFSIFVSLCLLKIKSEKINPYFCSYFFESDLVEEQIAFGSKKSTISNLHLDKIKEFVIFLPPLNEQLEITNYLDKVTKEYDELINKVKLQIEQLKEYRQSLIYEAVTGKIDVRELVAET